MSNERVIKKYANRRLYDSTGSRHVTLDDLRKMIVSGDKVKVIDDKSGEDLTRAVLLQVIAEQEQSHGTILSQDFLAELIRSHDVGIEGVLSSYLEQILRLFLSQTPPAGDPAIAASQLAHQNYQRWHSAQEEIFRTLMKAANAAPT